MQVLDPFYAPLVDAEIIKPELFVKDGNYFPHLKPEDMYEWQFAEYFMQDMDTLMLTKVDTGYNLSELIIIIGEWKANRIKNYALLAKNSYEIIDALEQEETILKFLLVEARHYFRDVHITPTLDSSFYKFLRSWLSDSLDKWSISKQIKTLTSGRYDYGKFENPYNVNILANYFATKFILEGGFDGFNEI